jgi:hypothetical protein
VALGASDGEGDLLVASRMGRHRFVSAASTKRATVRVPVLTLNTWSQRCAPRSAGTSDGS